MVKDIIGDDEAAKIFGISRDTLRHHCMKSFVCREGTVDIRKACPVIVGNKRRWNVHNILGLLNGSTN